MIIEGSRNNYEVFLEMIQFEITGLCNMRCDHCRAWKEPKGNLSLKTIERVLDFALPEASKEVRFTISGGEPLLNPDFINILNLINKKIQAAPNTELDHCVITTNGSLVNKKIIEEIEKINLGEVFLQVSIDSHDPNKHDMFRHYEGAFMKAKKALKLISDSKLTSLLRTTITKKNLNYMEEIIALANECGVEKVSLGPVIPTGKGKTSKELILDPKEKKFFIENILALRKKFPHISISTEDPIKFSICADAWDYGDYDYSKENFIGGCSAGIINLNVLSDGTFTPCSMMQTPILNATDKSVKEIHDLYTKSEVISNLVERNVKGKCSGCKYKRLCGGCRATALGITGDYLGEDPTCWRV